MQRAKARLAGYGDGEATTGERMTEAGTSALSDPDFLSGDGWQFAFHRGFKGQRHGEAKKLKLGNVWANHLSPPAKSVERQIRSSERQRAAINGLQPFNRVVRATRRQSSATSKKTSEPLTFMLAPPRVLGFRRGGWVGGREKTGGPSQ